MLNVKLRKTYYTYAVYIAEFLDKIRLSHAQEISQKLPIGKLPFSLMQFFREHRNDIIHLSGDQFEIPEINQVFSISSKNFWSYKLALDSYFKEKRRMHFLKREGNIYAFVKKFIFLLPFPYGVFELAETFYDECYGGFDVHNGTVIDIGAFIGDTAIYFAGMGAKKVIAFEPAPPLYEMAVKNVRMNRLDNIISVKKEAVGEKSGETMLKYERSWPGWSSLSLDTRSVSSECYYYPVKIIPFSDVVCELGPVDLVKIDCEGCEHRIFLHADKSGVLKNIENIIVEVHGNSNTIIRLLNKSSYRIIRKTTYSPSLHLIHACKDH
jgi:FkbM family methyltransferase